MRVLERNASDGVNPTILIQFGSLFVYFCSHLLPLFGSLYLSYGTGRTSSEGGAQVWFVGVVRLLHVGVAGLENKHGCGVAISSVSSVSLVYTALICEHYVSTHC